MNRASKPAASSSNIDKNPSSMETSTNITSNNDNHILNKDIKKSENVIDMKNENLEKNEENELPPGSKIISNKNNETILLSKEELSDICNDKNVQVQLLFKDCNHLNLSA
jgi:hypothetical protein